MTEPADVTGLDADEAIEAIETAREEVMLDPYRSGQTIELQAGSELWVTGDLHDHRGNFRKLLAAADLANNPRRHLLLHELIHGSYFDESGAEDSWKMLYQACVLKADFPEQVHFVLANHDLAQIHGEGISKAGLNVCEAFTKALKRDFKSRYSTVEMAITEFYLALPLAVRTPGGTFVCHSLPTDQQLGDFDFTVFERETLSNADYKRKDGPVYQLIWGRNISPESAERFAEHVNAQVLITGHQPQDNGFAVNGDKHLIVASDHNQGMFLPLSTDETYTMDTLTDRLRRFVAVDPDDPSTFE